MPGDILGCFNMCFSLILDIFATLSIQSFKNLTQMLCHENVHVMFQCKCNYVVLMFGVEPVQLVLCDST